MSLIKLVYKSKIRRNNMFNEMLNEEVKIEDVELAEIDFNQDLELTVVRC